MNKILVLFDSASGNTRSMAALIAEGAQTIGDTEVRLRHIDEASADDVVWCDGLAVGSPTNMGILSWKMKRFWDETMRAHWMKVDGKIACAFSSAAASNAACVVRADRRYHLRIFFLSHVGPSLGPRSRAASAWLHLERLLVVLLTRFVFRAASAWLHLERLLVVLLASFVPSCSLLRLHIMCALSQK